tara:strand:- start:263 stop:1207 length:945 start_codon:yes stop_codon:yes gene_type:complete
MAKPEKIKIGFAGTPEVAFAHFEYLQNNPHIDISFVLTQPNKKTGRGLGESKTLFSDIDKKVLVLQPDSLFDEDAVSSISNIKIDLLVVVAYGKILPDWLLEYPSFGCLNVHFSQLPKWRGAAPIQRAIANGDKVSGISFMKIVNELDAGPIYESYDVNIEENDFYQAEKKLLETSLANINSVINEIVINNKQPQEQEHKAATLAEKINPSEATLDWKCSANEIKSKFLAFKKWPVVNFKLNDQKIQIHDLEIASNQSAKPGIVSDFTKDSLDVFCGDGVIKIKSVKFPGKKVISAIDFFNAKRDIISCGDILI